MLLPVVSGAFCVLDWSVHDHRAVSANRTRRRVMPEQARQDVRRHSRRRSRTAELARAVARVQALEPRVLLASTLDNGVLTADGTGGDDDLRVDRASGQIIVTL